MLPARPILFGISLGVVVILLLESFGLAAPVSPNTRVATVNGEIITLAEVDGTIKQRPAPLSAPTVGQERQMRLEVLTVLIDDMLLKQFLRDHGPKIDVAEVNKQFAALEAGLKAQKRTLGDYLRELSQTEAQVRSNLTTMLQLDRYVKDHSNEADMKKYYETNKDYFDKTMVRTSHIVLRLPSNASEADRAAAKQKLQSLRADILAGRRDFAKAALELSQCPSASKGGDIGFIERKFQNVEEAYAKAAFSLKVGDISEVVETDFGCHLIKMTERKEGTPTKYEQSVDIVRDCYAEDLRIALLNQLRKNAKVEITLP